MKIDMDRVFELLHKTAQADPLATEMLDSQKQNNVFEKISQEIRGNRESYADDHKKLLELIMEGMAQYIRSRETPPSLRQKPWDACNAWIGRIEKELNTRSRKEAKRNAGQPHCSPAYSEHLVCFFANHQKRRKMYLTKQLRNKNKRATKEP